MREERQGAIGLTLNAAAVADQALLNIAAIAAAVAAADSATACESLSSLASPDNGCCGESGGASVDVAAVLPL